MYGPVMRATPALLALLLAAAAALPAVAEGRRARFDTRVFAAVGTPGYPEPVAIGPDGLVYVGTNNASAGAAAVLVYDLRGRLVRREVIRDQGLTREHGIQGLAFDGSGLLYALDRSAAHSRVIVIDPATGKQRDYATFSDVPLCGAARRRNCSASTVDRSAGPDYATFAPGGALYVTDIDQGLIWKVSRGGGRARVWFTDPLLNSPFGPNGIQFHRDGRTLRFAQTISGAPGDRAAGLLLDLPVKRDGRPGRLRRFWRSRPGDGVDGFAIARSGNVYSSGGRGRGRPRLSRRRRGEALPGDRSRQRPPPRPLRRTGEPRLSRAPAARHQPVLAALQPALVGGLRRVGRRARDPALPAGRRAAGHAPADPPRGDSPGRRLAAVPARDLQGDRRPRGSGSGRGRRADFARRAHRGERSARQRVAPAASPASRACPRAREGARPSRRGIYAEDMSERHRVVVVGGGFGGLQAVKHLAGAPVDVTLVDRRNFHLFQPLAYQVATGRALAGRDLLPAARASSSGGATCASCSPRSPASTSSAAARAARRRPATRARAARLRHADRRRRLAVLLLRPRRVAAATRPS